jgi:hypothetical protein
MRSLCRVLVVENFPCVDEVLSIVDDQVGYEVMLAPDRDAAFNELDRGAVKAPYTAAIIGGGEPSLDLKLAEYAALRGCVVIAAVEGAGQREPFLARGYDLVEVPCREEELIVRLATARLRAGLIDRRGRVRVAETHRRRRFPLFRPDLEFRRAAL